MSVRLDPVDRAVTDLAAGRPVIVLDAADREDEGDLIVAADRIDAATMAFVVRHSSGFVCVALTGADADRLGLPPMWAHGEDPRGTAYTVTVDARDGATTGISAADRARTARLLADPGTTPQQLTRPGHVVPLRARAGGVRERAGHTEAAVDLARLAGLAPAAVLAEVVSETDPADMARAPELRAFADRHHLAMIDIAGLAAHLDARTRRSQASVPLASGPFTAVAYPGDHAAFVYGDDAAVERLRGSRDVLVRVHSECLTGDVFGSLRCDCGSQFTAALEAVAREGRGVVVYLRGHEGRGIGLGAKLDAYRLQDSGADTVQANRALGLPDDARDYRAAASVIADLGIASVRLLTHNPAKTAALRGLGVVVTGEVGLPTVVTAENRRYLRTKRDRMGHTLDLGPVRAVDMSTHLIEERSA